MPSKLINTPSPVSPPTCPFCATAMRFKSITPDLRFIDIRNMTYGCKCGHTIEHQIVEKK